MSPDHSVTAFAPATIGNVICGFDVFGLALESPGDLVTVRLTPESGLRISRIVGDGGRLPTDPGRNSATVGISALLKEAGRSEGMEVVVEKGLPLSGGMGGSAASAVAAVVAADRLLATDLSEDELLSCALAGEQVAAGSAHLDNVAPALLGGLLLVRPSRTQPVVRLPVPEGLTVALLHPAVELSTREGRQAIDRMVPLGEAVAQWGNTAAFVHALHAQDWELLADSLEDRIAEPHRRASIPTLDSVRRAALAAGAIACGISGAGPSIFSLCRDAESARRIGEAMLTAYSAKAEPDATIYHSPVAPAGARVVSPTEGGVR